MFLWDYSSGVCLGVLASPGVIVVSSLMGVDVRKITVCSIGIGCAAWLCARCLDLLLHGTCAVPDKS